MSDRAKAIRSRVDGMDWAGHETEVVTAAGVTAFSTQIARSWRTKLKIRAFFLATAVGLTGLSSRHGAGHA